MPKICALCSTTPGSSLRLTEARASWRSRRNSVDSGSTRCTRAWLHAVERADGARQLTLQRALERHALRLLGGAQSLAIEDLEADATGERRAAGHERQPDVVHAVRGHADRGAAVGELIVDLLLLELGDDARGIRLGEPAEQHRVFGAHRPPREHHGGDEYHRRFLRPSATRVRAGIVSNH